MREHVPNKNGVKETREHTDKIKLGEKEKH